ncbi:hypothetical protein [Flavobacterium sp.]|uniref:hypothetical protein n=1 Tax=Flavobacterium sp. TaxID=239 RepID=UPI0039E70F16
MKTLQYLFFGAMATLLMAADCSNEDNEFYNDVFISSPNLVSVDASDGQYNVGENLMVSAFIPKHVDEVGQANQLDLYKTTGGALSFTFSYVLERKDANGLWNTVNIDEVNTVRSVGETTPFGDFMLAKAYFDLELQAYEYNGGIKLTTAGEYRLRFTYNDGVSPNVVLTSDSVNNNLFVTIYSLCEETPGGYYVFNVI